MTTQPRHLHRLLSLFDPLLCRPALVVKAHYRPARGLQVSHDEPHSWEQLPGMELHLRHDSSCRIPTCRLVEKALVPHDRFMAGPSHRTSEQLRDISLQIVVGGYADGIPHASLLQRLVNLRLGKGSIGAKHHFLTQFLLALNFRQ